MLREIVMGGALLLLAMPAQAAVHVLTVTGTLQTDPGLAADQIDRHGFFGTPGRQMAGQAFVATWRIDTRAGWQVIPPDPGGSTTVIRSGQNPYFGFGDAIVGSFSMAGVTFRSIGLPSNPYDLYNGIGSQTQMALSDYTYGDQIAINSTTSVNYPSTAMTINGRTLAGGTVSMNATFATRTGPNLFTPGVFFNSFELSDAAGELSGGANGQFSVGGNGMGSNYYFRTSTVSMQLSAVPEPANWAMLIAGFGLVGALARRRRAMVPVVAA
jgi:hypothetical protein